MQIVEHTHDDAPRDLTNVPSETEFDKLMSATREFGRDEAKGVDALPKLGIAVITAGANGVLPSGKDSDGKDAAAILYEAYYNARGKKVLYDAKAPNIKAQVSKLRQLVAFSTNPKIEPIDVFYRFNKIRDACVAKGDDTLKPMYAAMVDMAREQQKQDDELTDAELFAVMHKGEGAETTVEGELKKLHKKMEKLAEGEAVPGVAVKDPEFIKAKDLIGSIIGLLESKAKVLDALEAALEAGVITQEAYDERIKLAA